MTLVQLRSSPSSERRALGSQVMSRMAEVCTLFDLTQRSVRFYEEWGLIVTIRDGKNRRLFDAAARARLAFIAVLRRAGVSLVDIQTVLDQDAKGATTQAVAAIAQLRERRALLQEQMTQIDAAVLELQRQLNSQAGPGATGGRLIDCARAQ